MFFMTKSALCIGVVTVLAAGAAGGGDLRTSFEGGSREAAASLGRACAASRDCVGLGTRIVSAAVGQSGAVPEAITQAGIAQASEAIAVPQAPVSSVPASRVESLPRRADRHVRRTGTARD